LTENSTGDRGQIVFKNGASEVAELLLKEHRSWKKRYKRGPRLAFTLTLGSKAVDGKWRIQRVLAEVTARQKVIETNRTYPGLRLPFPQTSEPASATIQGLVPAAIAVATAIVTLAILEYLSKPPRLIRRNSERNCPAVGPHCAPYPASSSPGCDPWRRPRPPGRPHFYWQD